MTYVDSAGVQRARATGEPVKHTSSLTEIAPRKHIPPRPLKSNKPKGPPRWSHQRELEGMKGQQIRIAPLGDDDMEVTLLEADQFTLKVRDDEGTTLTLFKHALAGYETVEVKA